MCVLIAGFVYLIAYGFMSVIAIKDYIKFGYKVSLMIGIFASILSVISLLCICAGISHIATCQDKDFKPSYCEEVKE